MLILEGADNLGKTTAARRMVEIAQAKGIKECVYRHMGRPGPTFDFCYDYVSMMDRSVIQDRFHLGSIVWHDDVMNLSKLRYIEGQLSLHGAFIVVMVADMDSFNYRKMINPERELLSADTIVRANRMYELMSIPAWDDGHIAVTPDSYASSRDAEIIFNLRPRVDEYYIMSDETDFPHESLLEHWVDKWMEVRRVAFRSSL